MAKVKLTDAAAQVFELLEPLESDERTKVVQSAFALLGETGNVRLGVTQDEAASDDSGLPIGARAKRWMNQNQVREDELLEIFHFDNGNVEVISSGVPGRSNAAKSQNCYLLTGICGLLATDDAAFNDKEAVELCNHMRCYDSANNSIHRKALGLGGSKKAGFKLTAPCLRKAAELVKEMAEI